MKTLLSPVHFTPTWPLAEIAPPQKILFFDIETTGFSADYSAIYLIGCIHHEPTSNTWQLTQWFSETPEDEPMLLTAFFTFLSNYTTLIHYNGDAFDLPFIRKRSQHHNLNCPLSQITSLDLYRKIRPWKAALSLTSLKQTSLERFLDIRRVDSYTGRQLIAAYQDYLSTKKTALFHLLLQHNQEDLRGLLKLLPLLTYALLPEMSFSPVRQTIIPGPLSFIPDFPQTPGASPAEPKANTDNDHPALDRTSHACLELSCQLPSGFGAFPAPFQIKTPLFSLQGQDTQILCCLPLYKGELKYFYPDYKNYYYLPCEDMAIHKSVGSYVAKEARKKATPQTCYVKKSSLFLPQMLSLWQPAFYFSYQSSPAYAEYHEEYFSEPDNLSALFGQLLPHHP